MDFQYFILALMIVVQLFASYKLALGQNVPLDFKDAIPIIGQNFRYSI